MTDNTTSITTPPSSPRRDPVRVLVDAEGRPQIEVNEGIAEALLGPGGDPVAAAVLLQRLATIAGPGALQVNGAVALLVGLEPRDTAEAMIAAQAVAVHELALDLHAEAARSSGVRNHAEICRTALAASRTMGELLQRLHERRRPAVSAQRITVERIDGGQIAIGCAPGPGADR